MEAIMPPAVEQPSVDQLIVVHNLHHPQAWQPLPGFVDEYVDRRSPLGNPYVMGEDGHDEAYRGAVCDAYEAFLNATPGVGVADVAETLGVRVSRDFRREDAAERREQEMRRLGRLLDQGKRLRLKCWCAPRRCHAHSIARWLLQCHSARGPAGDAGGGSGAGADDGGGGGGAGSGGSPSGAGNPGGGAPGAQAKSTTPHRQGLGSAGDAASSDTSGSAVGRKRPRDEGGTSGERVSASAPRPPRLPTRPSMGLQPLWAAAAPPPPPGPPAWLQPLGQVAARSPQTTSRQATPQAEATAATAVAGNGGDGEGAADRGDT